MKLSCTFLVSLLTVGTALAATEAPQNVVRMALSTEPPNLNSMKATDQQSIFVLGHVMEGLTRYGQDGKVIPGVAEKWEITDKGATFHLRKNAMWSDGKPVTAKDFVFAWKTALDPKTASEYAFILYPIKNAETINQGKGGELGAVAENDHTLKITFEKPCGYFLSLTAFVTYLPAREDYFNTKKDRYAADHTDMLYNGPFALTSWVHGASLTMDKNNTYWNKDKIALDRVDIPYITPDNSARYNFFKDKKTDLLEGVNKDDLAKARADGFKPIPHQDGSVFFMEFNFRDGHAVKNKNLRKAIQAVFDPTEFVTKVVAIPGTKPGTSLIPAWVPGVKTTLRKEFPIKTPKPDYKKAKEYLEAAKKELGGSIPALVWLTGDTPQAGKEAEYFQQVFKNKLGIDLKIDKQIFKQRLAKMSAGEFDIVAAGWGPDYPDAMTFADLMTTWNENNRGKYASAAYDELIRKAQNTADPKTRITAMAEAEKIALDDLAILPTLERAIMWVKHDNVEGIVRHQIGPDPDFTNARVVKKNKVL